MLFTVLVLECKGFVKDITKLKVKKLKDIMVRVNDEQELIFNAVKSRLEKKETGLRLSDAEVFRSSLRHMATFLGIDIEALLSTIGITEPQLSGETS